MPSAVVARSPTRGNLALGLATGPAARVAWVGLWWLPFVVLTVLAARSLPFQRHRWLKVGGVNLVSLAIGIGAVLLDELFGIHGN